MSKDRDFEYESAVKFNPQHGQPNFYVESPYPFPVVWQDPVDREVKQMLSELDDKLDKPVTLEHVKEDVPLTTVEYDDEWYSVNQLVESMEWYSEEPIHTFE